MTSLPGQRGLGAAACVAAHADAAQVVANVLGGGLRKRKNKIIVGLKDVRRYTYKERYIN